MVGLEKLGIRMEKLQGEKPSLAISIQATSKHSIGLVHQSEKDKTEFLSSLKMNQPQDVILT